MIGFADRKLQVVGKVGFFLQRIDNVAEKGEKSWWLEFFLFNLKPPPQNPHGRRNLLMLVKGPTYLLSSNTFVANVQGLINMTYR